MKNIVLIGPPGSGKGTLSKKLQDIGYLQISTGDLLREEAATGSELGTKIAERINNGFMVEDEISLAVMRQAMNKATSGCIFDGYPRNVVQAQMLEDHLHQGDPQDLIIIYLNMSLDLVAERIINRKTCGDCGEILNLKTKKPKVHGDKEICPKCASENLIKRSDDNQASLNNRFQVYQDKTSFVVDKYRNYKNFNEIDASQSENIIWEQVKKII